MKTQITTLLTAGFAVIAVACSPVAKNTAQVGDQAGIINGKPVTEGAPVQKSIVAIYNAKIGALCTGSLLTPDVVLTAAHCIVGDAKDHLVFFAADFDGNISHLSDVVKKRVADEQALQAAIDAKADQATLQKLADVLKQDIENHKAALVKVRSGVKAIVNQEYVSEDKESAEPPPKTKEELAERLSRPTHDTALLKLNAPAPEGFVPATLVASEGDLTPNGAVTIVGYGVSSSKKVMVKPDPTKEFQDKIDSGEVACDTEDAKTAKTCMSLQKDGSGQLRIGEATLKFALNDFELVTENTSGTTACNGDSGGPAYVKKGDKYLLWGIASRVLPADCSKYAIYTFTFAMKKWIDTNLAEIQK